MQEKTSQVLNNFEKGLIIGMSLAKQSAKEIKLLLEDIEIEVCLKTIYNVINKWEEDQSYENNYQGNCGRPQIMTEEGKQTLFQYIEQNLTASRIDLQNNKEANPDQVSASTLVRCLQDSDYKQVSRPKIFKITEDNPKVRLEWCKNMLRVGKRIINNAIYTDESWIFYSHVHKQYYWIKKGEEIEYENQQKQQKWPQKIMIWAAIHRDGPLDLQFIEGTMNQDKYLEVLENFFIDKNHLNYAQNSYFQQDNSTSHKTQKILNFFTQNQINLLQWPANSPDISPIEYVWFTLKNLLNKEIDRIQSFEELKQRVEIIFYKSESIKQCIQNSIKKVPQIMSDIVINKGYPK
ncbi:hypothetical protein ABPG72_022857 [Tetrahymena utriculariae]